jgi:hypothetical protein
MPSSERAPRQAACTNDRDCAKAAAGETLEWYPGAGEYCPECGEVLTPVAAAMTEREAPQAAASRVDTTTVGSLFGTAALGRRLPAAGRKTWLAPLRWLWLVAAMLVAGSAIIYAERRAQATDRSANDPLSICPIPSAQALVGDIVRGYAAKSGVPANQFVVTSSGTCDVRFSTTAQTPDDVIARDGIVAVVNPLNAIPRISVNQLRAIFGGSVRDWSQVGGAPGRIVPILTDAASDEAKALGATLLYGVGIDGSVRRAGTSADVTRAVAGADRASRDAIGLVAFSQAVPARVVPLTYLPPPSMLTIASRRYPYTLTIAVESESAPAKSVAQAFVDYVRSNDAAAIVAKAGLVGREGP